REPLRLWHEAGLPRCHRPPKGAAESRPERNGTPPRSDARFRRSRSNARDIRRSVRALARQVRVLARIRRSSTRILHQRLRIGGSGELRSRDRPGRCRILGKSRSLQIRAAGSGVLSSLTLSRGGRLTAGATREGARRMLIAALEAEVAAFVEAT